MVFADTEIRFVDYPFAGASVFPDGVLAVSAITEADPDAIRPHLRTVAGETLFVHAEHRGALDDFCRRNVIAVHRRLDIWADLLEPFLDTWFDAEDQRATDARLHGAGLGSKEIAEIRGRIERRAHAAGIAGDSGGSGRAVPLGDGYRRSSRNGVSGTSVRLMMRALAGPGGPSPRHIQPPGSTATPRTSGGSARAGR